MTENLDTKNSSIRKKAENMKIYEATKADLEGVADIFNAYRMFYEQQEDRKAARQFIENRLCEKDAVIFIAKDQLDYIGFMQLYPTYSSISMKRAWILNDLYVVDTARRRGVAQSLINEAIALCKKTDAAYLTLETAATNEKAKKLYEKNGFICDRSFEAYQLNFNEKT